MNNTLTKELLLLETLSKHNRKAWESNRLEQEAAIKRVSCKTLILGLLAS